MYGGPVPIANPNAQSRMYGGPVPIANVPISNPNAQSRMYGGPIPIVNAPIVNPNQREEVPNVAPAPNQNAPILNNVRINRNNAVPAVNARVIQEEARELAEIHAKLAVHIGQTISSSSISNLEAQFIKQIQKAGEVILYTGGVSHIDRIPNLAGQYHTSLSTMEWILTDHNVYAFRYNRKTTGIDFNGKVISGLLVIPIYTFDKPLNLKQTKMLILLLGFNHSYYPSQFPSRHGSGVLQNMRGEDHETVRALDAHKKFESVIRLIPGSYQNSDWKQIDGFFGLYYNEKTMEML